MQDLKLHCKSTSRFTSSNQRLYTRIMRFI
uniref:Uncharacterized protein n=1 Tax=Arundo donax TaxID=35708 RepID=A0A0A8ZXK4_ARUDO